MDAAKEVKHPKCPICQKEHSTSLKVCPQPPRPSNSQVLPPLPAKATPADPQASNTTISAAPQEPAKLSKPTAQKELEKAKFSKPTKETPQNKLPSPAVAKSIADAPATRSLKPLSTKNAAISNPKPDAPADKLNAQAIKPLASKVTPSLPKPSGVPLPSSPKASPSAVMPVIQPKEAPKESPKEAAKEPVREASPTKAEAAPEAPKVAPEAPRAALNLPKASPSNVLSPDSPKVGLGNVIAPNAPRSSPSAIMAALQPANLPKASPSAVLAPVVVNVPKASPSNSHLDSPTMAEEAPKLPEMKEAIATMEQANPFISVGTSIRTDSELPPVEATKTEIKELPPGFETHASEIVAKVDKETGLGISVQELPDDEQPESIFAEARKSASFPVIKAVEAPAEQEKPSGEEKIVLPPRKGLGRVLAPLAKALEGTKLRGKESLVAAAGALFIVGAGAWAAWPSSAPQEQVTPKNLIAQSLPAPAEPESTSVPVVIDPKPTEVKDDRLVLHVDAVPTDTRVVVWINGEPQETISVPDDIKVPKDLQVELTFSAQGYAPQQKLLVVSQEQNLKVTLLPHKLVATTAPQVTPITPAVAMTPTATPKATPAVTPAPVITPVVTPTPEVKPVVAKVEPKVEPKPQPKVEPKPTPQPEPKKKGVLGGLFKK